MLSGATYSYAVTGPLAERMRALILHTYENLPHDNDPSVQELRQFKFVETDVPDPTASLNNNEIELYVDTLDGAEADRLAAKNESAQKPPSPTRRDNAPRRLKGVPLINVVYRG